MTFEEILDQAIAMLQRRGRVTYRTLQRQFQLDDAALDDLKDELIYGQRLAVDEAERVLVWSGEPASASAPPLAQDEQMLTHLREAETLAEGLADHRRLGRVYRRIAYTLRLMQDPEPALAYCQRTHAMATALGDVDLQMWVNYDMGTIYFELGDYRGAMVYLQQTLTALHGERRYQFFGGPALPSVQARAHMMRCLIELGEFAAAVAYGDEALQIAEAVDRPYERLAVYSRVGLLHVRQGTLHQAIPLLERMVALSQDTNVPLDYRISAQYLALAGALAGRATDALPLLEQVERDLAVRGEAYLLAGCVEEAHRLAQRVLTEARHRKMRGQEARALWLLGEIAMHRDPPDVAQATAHDQQALTLAEELGMRPLVAHCHCGLGTLYAATGQREPARAALAAAIALYRAMEMTFWLPQTEAALVQVEGV